MPLPIPFDLTTVLYVAAVLLLTGLLGAALLGGLHAVVEARQRRADLICATAAFRRCRYCRCGQALLHEEAVRFDSGDRVTTRTYVCNSCGLPQWLVQRVAARDYAGS